MELPIPTPSARPGPHRMPCSHSISVVLPAFDEEECIDEALARCLAFLPEHFPDWEVVVVDDGSRDATAAIVARIAATTRGVRLVRHERNLGYGRALATGFAAARKELVFFTDADCQFDVRELAVAVPLLESADAVLGFRISRYDSALRRVLSWGYNRLVRALFGIGVRDVDCSFKLFRHEVVERMRLESTDFFVDTEIVAQLARMEGVHAVELGVRHYPRMAGSTSVRPSDVPRTLWTVGRMWLRLRGWRAEPLPAAPHLRPAGARGPRLAGHASVDAVASRAPVSWAASSKRT